MSEHDKVKNSTLSGVVTNPAGFAYASPESSVLTPEPQKIIVPEFDPKIFNVGKTDYAEMGSLFMGQDPGLFDTLHTKHPVLKDLFREQRILDWDEFEVPFNSCNEEFKNRPPMIAKRMIDTLAWQWEADSVAARTMYSVMAPFITSSELSRAWIKVSEIEHLHAATYSEIVRNSFDDPRQVLADVLSNVEALQRMSVLGDVLKRSYRISHELALGMHKREDEHVYDAAMMATVAWLALERVQFMASFAVTCAVSTSGMFVPIGDAVRRICQDEYEVHVQLDKYVLRHELSLPCGQAFMRRNKPLIAKVFEDVIHSEFRWVDHMQLDEDPLAGVTGRMLRDGIIHSAADAMACMNMKPEHPVPRRMPLQFMDRWLDNSKVQMSPQEQRGTNQYKANMTRDNLGDEKLEYNF